MEDQSVKLNVTPEMRRQFNKVKEDLRKENPDRKIRTSEALEILINHYRNRFD